MVHKKYITSEMKKERRKTLAAVFSLVAVINAGTVGLILENQPIEPDVVYPMTNQHIEWTYAMKGVAGR